MELLFHWYIYIFFSFNLIYKAYHISCSWEAHSKRRNCVWVVYVKGDPERKWHRKKKTTNKGYIFKQITILGSWYLILLRIIITSVECSWTSEISSFKCKEAGAFVHELFFWYSSRAAFRAMNSLELLTYPVCLLCTPVGSVRWEMTLR